MPVIEKLDIDAVLHELTVFFRSLLDSKYPLEVGWNLAATVRFIVNEFIRSCLENQLSLEEERALEVQQEPERKHRISVNRSESTRATWGRWVMPSLLLGFSSSGSGVFCGKPCEECLSDREGVDGRRWSVWPAQTWFEAQICEAVNTWVALVCLASLAGLCLELAVAVGQVALLQMIKGSY